MSGIGSQLRTNSKSTVVLPAPAQALIAGVGSLPQYGERRLLLGRELLPPLARV